MAMAEHGASHVSGFVHSVLSFRPSLFETNKDIALAVIVQSEDGVYVIGRDPTSTRDVSRIAMETLRNLPELLERQITDLIQAGLSTNIIDSLASNTNWNLVLSQASFSESDLPLPQFAFAQFAEHISGLEPHGRQQARKVHTALRRDSIFEVSATGPIPGQQLPLDAIAV